MSDEIRISPARADSGTMSCSVHGDWSASSAAPYALDACFRIADLHNDDTVHHKCRLAPQGLTHGPGSDVRVGWPACTAWEAQ